MNRHATEGAAPLQHRGVVVRVGDCDRRDAAYALREFNRGVVDQGDAVPQNVAGRRVRQDRPLADAERRGGLDGREPRHEAAELVAVRIP